EGLAFDGSSHEVSRQGRNETCMWAERRPGFSPTCNRSTLRREMIPALPPLFQPAAVRIAHAHTLARHEAADARGAAAQTRQVGLHLGHACGGHGETQLVVVAAGQREI